ncbi:BON domain-containing protein [Rhizobium giardinii]|uniref:BON domain-containing protein n=1 Tax=Rhizobium giardinii TaxID=56731 RepID=UPI000DD60124
MNDNVLRQDIIDELEFEPSIDAADIGVAVENGVATLTGHVPTYAQKATIEEVVRRVAGVKGIAQEIEVRPFGANQTADDEIAKRALYMINWNTAVPKNAVQVKVQKGWVTLTGNVEWHYQKIAAGNAVRGLAGVSGVSNSIDLKPRVSVSDVKKRIQDALKRNAEVEAKGIRIDVLDGIVTLEGRVKAWPERDAAERAAWSAPGVKAVVDRITVG